MIATPHRLLRGRPLLISAVFAAFLLAIVWQTLSAQEIDPRPPDLTSSEKSVNRSQARAGAMLSYNIEISNEGTDPAPAVTMTDSLPAGLQLVTETVNVTGGGVYTYSGNTLTWSGAVNNGVSILISFNAQLSDTLAAGTWITNTAHITGTGVLIAPAAGTEIVEDTDTDIYLPVWFNPIPEPPVPSLAPLGETNINNEWTLSWSVSDNRFVDGYTIEESHNPDFSNPSVIEVTETSRSFNHPPSPHNSYYYRVRSHGPAGISDWSQTRMIIGNYRDNFDSDGSGWAMRRHDFDDTNNHSRYENGHFVMKIGGRWDYGVGGPMAMAPSAPFAIETRVRMEDADNLNSYGIVWGADWNGDTCSYEPQYTNNCFNHYYRLNIVWFGNPIFMHYELKRIDSHNPTSNTGSGPALINYNEVRVMDPSDGYQVWRVEHHANGDIRVFVNGREVGAVNDSTYLGHRHFGVFASSDEYLGSEPHYDWYSVTSLNE